MQNVPTIHTVAIVFADGQGSGLHELTIRESKPAVAFGGRHRIVDFTMAALVRSGLKRVVVATQYRPETLEQHLEETWRPALQEGLSLRRGTNLARAGYVGTADVLRLNTALMDAMGAREVLMVAADQVHAMDYRPMLAAHRVAGAPLTLAAIPLPHGEATDRHVVTEGADGRVASYQKMTDPPVGGVEDGEGSLASLGVYVLDWAWLKAQLVNPDIVNLGTDLIPEAVLRGEAAVWQWNGFWRDLGTLDNLRQTWLDFDATTRPCPWPVAPGVMPQTRGMQAERFFAKADLGGLRLMSPLLGADDPGRWAALDRSVLMPGARVNPGVRLTNVIVGPGAVIPEGLRIGEDRDEDRRWFRVCGETTLVTNSMVARRGLTEPRTVLASGHLSRLARIISGTT